MKVFFIIVTVSVLIAAFAEASLQCVSCTGGSCETSNPKTEDCDEKCSGEMLHHGVAEEESWWRGPVCRERMHKWQPVLATIMCQQMLRLQEGVWLIAVLYVRSLLLRRQMQLLFTSKGWNNHGCRVRCYCSCQISVLLEGGNKSITVLDWGIIGTFNVIFSGIDSSL